MRSGERLGGTAAGAWASAFLCGLAGPAFAPYTGRSFEPQLFAEAT